MKRDIKYLKLLAKNFPTEQSAITEIINLEAILHLPKGTEHYVTDLHGENEAFDNVLRNASGSIRDKVETLFQFELVEQERRDLCALIYYPEDKLKTVHRRGKEMEQWQKITLMRLVRVLSVVSSKYSRSKVRKALPKQYSYIIEELLHESQEDSSNKQKYLTAIVDTIVTTGSAENFIVAICYVIQRLIIDHLHIIGDIYDRGPGAHKIMDRIISYHDYDIQWGNHDLVWMGAAAGSEACIANVLRMCFRYSNLITLEEGYGINLLPLATFAMQAYADDPCLLFAPKENAYESVDSNQKALMAKMHKAIAVIQFKLEDAIVARRKEFNMEDRRVLNNIDFNDWTFLTGGKKYPLRDNNFPTVDPEHPAKLTPEEKDVMKHLVSSFRNSVSLSRHMECLFSHGSMYLVRNNNLLFHGSVPLNEDGSFASLQIQNRMYSGKALMDKMDSLARSAFYEPDGTTTRLYGQDMIWYMWCGPVSPPFDKAKMATFERYFIDDKSTHKENKGFYYTLKNNKEICDNILREFGIKDVEHAHIINGHIPVKASKGESPVKAEGKLLVIDGGYSKAYQSETGIAGYTLIYNSHGLKLVRHEPFESRQKIVQHGADVLSVTQVVDFMQNRRLVRDTDKGRELSEQINDLVQLLSAYRSGQIR